MPGLDPGTHDFGSKTVDGRDKPGHDEFGGITGPHFLVISGLCG
jgi:hypothetical protein